MLGFISMCFIFLVILASLSTIYIVCGINPIVRIGFLVILFTIGAMLFMLLDFYFLGLTYIIVYVGAIAILFLFVIMMVNLPTISTFTFFSYRPVSTGKYGAGSDNKIYFSNSNRLGIELKNEIKIETIPTEIYKKDAFDFSTLTTDILPSWTYEYFTIVDIDSLGFLTYIGYPNVLVLISIALWAVLIGVITICRGSIS